MMKNKDDFLQFDHAIFKKLSDVLETQEKFLGLIGLPGVGKTSFGKYLSQILQIDFIDSDDEVERLYGMTIMNLFKRFGETEFRKIEYEVIQDILNRDMKAVISFGGGVVEYPPSFSILQKQTYLIWLQRSITNIAQNLENDKLRPLFQGVNIEQKLAELFRKRGKKYKLASLIINLG
jgi:shikimate kinase